MSSKDRICHEGIVRSISAQTIEIAIASHSACSECHAKGACGMSEITQKIITARRPAEDLKPGDKVTVYATLNNAIYSVILAYVLPSVLIIGTLFLLVQAGIGEVAAAGISLGVIAVYFILLFLFRRKIGKRIEFTVEK